MSTTASSRWLVPSDEQENNAFNPPIVYLSLSVENVTFSFELTTMTDLERRLLQLLTQELPEDAADYIARLDRWLANNRPDYYQSLQPGVSNADLDQFEVDFNVRLPESFRTFYRWRNGQANDCYASLQDNRMLMSLENIRAAKEVLDGMIGADFEAQNWWRREWVPFLDNGGGDHLCLDLSPMADGISPRVREFWHDMPERDVTQLTFQSWLGVLVEQMEEGRYEVV
jgi:cell wall assembly regulator SMI1